MKTRIHIEEISNRALQEMIEKGELDDPRGVTKIFRHRYQGGQCDWGYIDQDGTVWAWFGANPAQEIYNDTASDPDPDDYPDGLPTMISELDILDEWSINSIDQD